MKNTIVSNLPDFSITHFMRRVHGFCQFFMYLFRITTNIALELLVIYTWSQVSILSMVIKY